jgi:hypothetical protein
MLILLKSTQTPLAVSLTLPDDIEAWWEQQQRLTSARALTPTSRLFGNRETYRERSIDDFRREMWKSIVQPIVAELRAQHIPPMSRIWWCPTGIFGKFPLHAAGDLPDIHISSYTPTISSLITAREALRDDMACPPNPLIVGASRLAGHTPLPQVRVECELV